MAELSDQEKLAAVRQILKDYQAAHGGYPEPEAAQLAFDIADAIDG